MGKRIRAWSVGLVGVVALCGGVTAVPASAVEQQVMSAAPMPDIEIVPVQADVRAAQAARIAGEMSDEQLVGSVLMGNISSQDPLAVIDYIRGNNLGGFILMGPNVGGPNSVQIFSDAIMGAEELPPLLGIDQEGGVVSRLWWDRAAAGSRLADDEPSETERAFAERGATVANAGIGVNFGIVADVTDDRSSFISSRVLGRTVSESITRVAAAVTSESPYALSTLKHFPGHGAVGADSHFTIPQTDMPQDVWEASEKPPFAAGVAAGAPLVMMGHLAYTAVDPKPASVSGAWYDILRDDLGFSGVAVTDDLGMLPQSGDPAYADLGMDAVAALVAGADLILFVAGATPDTPAQLAGAIRTALDNGTLPRERLLEAATRVIDLRLQQDARGSVARLCNGDC